jgi:predicted nucleotidyltransferase
LITEILDEDKNKGIQEFCVQHNIQSLYFFGSIVNSHFSQESDLDIMVSFKTTQRVSLFDFIEIEEKLSKLFSKKVDLISKNSVENSLNSILKNSILLSAVKIYEAN